ncbi:hypothetical protein [Rubritalea sp.]|uniref:hypothetical protein n=1 Tax=Rubritalea sp. TaxID=2109375 RepID=UPI003EF5D993
MRTPSYRYTIGLLLFFFIPFWLKDSLREIYPAVLMPGGANTTSVDDESVSATLYRCIATDTVGVSKEVELRQLSAPAPSRIAKYIIDNDLGLTIDRIEFVKKHSKWPYKAAAATESNVAECKQWYRKKLGEDCVTLEVSKIKVKISKSTGKIISEEIVNEDIYQLR